MARKPGVEAADPALSPKTPAQAEYVQAIRDPSTTLVFGVGPAGTGKTYLAVCEAAAALKRGDVRRIILSRPAVEAGESLGFLPGDLQAKIDPYLLPLYDALEMSFSTANVEKMMRDKIIEVAPIAFMRGRTLGDAIIILDEAQNTTIAQIEMVITRIGECSKLIITGDPGQRDIRGRSGLGWAVDALSGVEGVNVTRFTKADIVRSQFVARVVDAFECYRAVTD